MILVPKLVSCIYTSIGEHFRVVVAGDLVKVIYPGYDAFVVAQFASLW